MRNRYLLDGLLYSLILLGLFGALRVSYNNATGISTCPYLLSLPVCYLVSAAYTSMLLSLLIPHNGCKHHLFCIGWAVAFLVAAAGTVMQWLYGNTCPISGGVALCYVSLGMCVAILVLFLAGPYQRACDIHNAAA
jgi:hypothetical protein